MKKGSNRPTIGLFIFDLDSEYATMLVKSTAVAATEFDINLVIFTGNAMKCPYDFLYQKNSIYDLAVPGSIDALIVPAGLLNYLSEKEFQNFCERYTAIPTVSISYPLPGTPCIHTNNKNGLADALRHVITVHKRRRIAYIKGPENHCEAIERYETYQAILKENQISFDPSLVCPGDFSHFCIPEAIKTLLDERKVKFDALFTANDEMALAALELLLARGIHVPEDVALVGFDNIEATKYTKPAITTVQQPIYQMANEAVKAALALIRGEKPGNITFNSEVVLRESCGCLPEIFRTQLITEAASSSQSKKKGSEFDEQAFISGQISCAPRIFSNTHITEFIGQVFETFQESDDNPEKIQSLLKLFASIFDFTLANEEILYLQNLLIGLRQEILKANVSDEKKAKIEDFFHHAWIRLTEIVQRSNETRRTVHHQNIHFLRDILKSMVAKVYDRDEILKALIYHLQNIGIENCYIYLYDNEVPHTIDKLWEAPPNINLVIAYNKEGLNVYAKDGISIPTRQALSSRFLPQNHRYTIIANSLFFMDNQLGFVIYDFNPKDWFIYGSLFTEISCGLKLSLLVNAREQIENKLKDTLKELEDYNLRLDQLSRTDELTGIYNRRGFLTLARKSLYLARRMKKTGLLFFADFDGLKRINDTYGHHEGDEALRQTALILKKIFRKSDIIARLGGDEFTIFTANTNTDFIRTINERLNRTLTKHNEQSNKQYQISISLGAVAFTNEDTYTIEELLAQADDKLYAQKKIKKQV